MGGEYGLLIRFLEVDSEGCRFLELGLCIVNFCSEAANKCPKGICPKSQCQLHHSSYRCLLSNFASERDVKLYSVHLKNRIMGETFGLLIRFWNWRVKVVVGIANWVVYCDFLVRSSYGANYSVFVDIFFGNLLLGELSDLRELYRNVSVMRLGIPGLGRKSVQ